MNRLPALIASCALLVGFLACAKIGSSYPDNPKDVLTAFVETDSKAAALSAQTWPELARYTTWHDAPRWDKFMIVDHYEITDVRAGSTRAQAKVTYHNLGVMSTGFTYDPKPEQVVFYINKTDGGWKVDLPQLMPHISWPVFQERLNQASATDPKTKAANDALIGQIAAAAQKHS